MERTVPEPDPWQRPSPTPVGHDGGHLLSSSVFWDGLTDLGQILTRADWVVVLESAMPTSGRRLRAVEDLLEELAEWSPSVLYNEESYAVQLHLAAVSGADALRQAAMHHDRAVLAVGLGGTALVRAEVLTLAEYDQDCRVQLAESLAEPAGAAAWAALIPDRVHQATRALLDCATPEDVQAVLVDFVLSIGGFIHRGPRPHEPAVVTAELSITPGEDLYAVADTVSMAGLMVERHVPTLVDDARRAAPVRQPRSV